jgi:predicted unusual protein kinase regulating ubiquinone biosynthesis (AarF/ABC1/UbiB family)
MADEEENSIGGRLKRYARVGAAVGGIGLRFGAGRVFGIDLDKGKHAGELRLALGGLKGPLMKVAQLLSTIPNALPEEYVQELIQLQSNAPSMGWPFVRRRMASELGTDWEKKFVSFTREAVAAASLGQVHRARTHDDEDVACKLQYPEMHSTVEADLRQLKLVFALFERYDRAVNTREIHAELTARLREELDYEREAKHMRLYGHMLKDETGVHIPEAVPSLSTRRLLTMSWLDGAKLLSVKDWPVERRNEVAINMFRAWYVPFYFYGVIHGDPHLGNYTVRDDGTVNLLDFGCIRIFPPSFVGGVIDLYKALRDGDQALAVSAYETWGFSGLSKELIGVLNQWAAFVYAPLMEDRPRQIEETNSGVYGQKVAGKVHEQLRKLGGVTPPREFVLMDRAAIGLGSVFLHLKAEINWHRQFHDLIRDFDLDRLAKRQAAALKSAKISKPA